jgi:hypothetical protein
MLLSVLLGSGIQILMMTMVTLGMLAPLFFGEGKNSLNFFDFNNISIKNRANWK